MPGSLGFFGFDAWRHICGATTNRRVHPFFPSVVRVAARPDSAAAGDVISALAGFGYEFCLDILAPG
jgi:hypothetical protein